VGSAPGGRGHRQAQRILVSMAEMRAEDLKAYAMRAWHVAAAFKQQYWAHEIARQGSLATFEASQTLREHMRRVRPDWPSEQDRGEDLAHHLALKRAIDSAAGAFLAAASR
jgi:hypothetical protein